MQPSWPTAMQQSWLTVTQLSWPTAVQPYSTENYTKLFFFSPPHVKPLPPTSTSSLQLNVSFSGSVYEDDESVPKSPRDRLIIPITCLMHAPYRPVRSHRTGRRTNWSLVIKVRWIPKMTGSKMTQVKPSMEDHPRCIAPYSPQVMTPAGILGQRAWPLTSKTDRTVSDHLY